jgi:hypothetical protein
MLLGFAKAPLRVGGALRLEPGGLLPQRTGVVFGGVVVGVAEELRGGVGQEA